MTNTFASIDAAQIVALLRSHIFELTAQDLQLGSSRGAWGVVMETTDANETVTLVVLADGSVSLYLHSGDGRIGCGVQPRVSVLGARMLQLAQSFVPEHVSEAPCELPSVGHVRFYFYTSNGLSSIDALRAQLAEGAVDLAELYYAGQAVIGMVELTSAGQSITDAIQEASQSVRSQAASEAESRKSRLWRILPYAGNVVRRSRR